jgi:hypothetical protein
VEASSVTTLKFSATLGAINPKPILTGETTTVITPTTWAGTIETDQGTGIIYALANQNSSAVDQVIKDTGNVNLIFSAGVKELSVEGLAPGTPGYYIHIVHENADSVFSDVTTIGPFATLEIGQGTGEVTLTIDRDSDLKEGGIGIAPFTVFFKVSVTGASVAEPGDDAAFDPTVPRLHYVLDGGLGGVVPGQFMRRMRLGTNDLNKSAGKYPAMCYTSAGNYTATVLVYEDDGTLVGADTVVIPVLDPDDVFVGNRTILVNTAGQGDVAYPGAQVVTTLDAALNAQRVLDQSCQILLKSDGTYVKNTTFQAGSGDNNFMVRPYGAGAKPIVTFTGGSFSPAMFYLANLGNIEIVFHNIFFQGQWNSVTETGSGRNLCAIDQSSATTRRGMTFAGCEFDGWNEICQLRIDDFIRDVFMMVWDCETTNWNGFQFYGTANPGSRVCLKGVSGMQSETARMGGQGDGSGNSYGLFRCGVVGRLLIEVVETYCRYSRDNRVYSQPPLRINVGPGNPNAAIRRPVAMISRCYVEGGAQQISLSSASTNGTPVYGMNEVVERCTFVGTWITRYAIKVAHAGVEIRNNICIQPNGKRAAPYTTQYQAFIAADLDWLAEQQDSTSPVRVRYNTFINLLDGNNTDSSLLATLDMTTMFGGRYTEENNVLYTPNKAGQPGETPIGVSQVVMQSSFGDIVPAFTNVHHAATTALPAVIPPDFSFASPPTSIWDAKPLPGSALIGSATGRKVFNDHAGNVRPASQSRGAMELV